MKNIKMADVAKMAGVSLTTVGRALHGGYISEDKKIKIDEAIEKLGYVPNKMASSLKSDRSKLIGHLMMFNVNMLYAKISDGINKAASKAGYSVFALTVYNEDYSSAIDEFIARKVDAVIITSVGSIDEKLILKLRALDIPVLMIERYKNLLGIDKIIINDIGGAFTAVSKLIEKNKQKIAFIGVEPLDKAVEKERLEGYLQALSQYDINPNEHLIKKNDDYTIESGFASAKKIYEKGLNPEAFFCTSDLLAAGVMQYLYSRGIKIPSEVLVTGYDDTLATLLSPPINSVALDTDKIGETAVTALLDRIKNPDLEDKNIRIDTIYIERM